jgi:hypothetical protein
MLSAVLALQRQTVCETKRIVKILENTPFDSVTDYIVRRGDASPATWKNGIQLQHMQDLASYYKGSMGVRMNDENHRMGLCVSFLHSCDKRPMRNLLMLISAVMTQPPPPPLKACRTYVLAGPVRSTLQYFVLQRLEARIGGTILLISQ